MWELPFKHAINNEKINLWIDPTQSVHLVLPIIQARIRVTMNLEPNTYNIYFHNINDKKIILTPLHTPFKYLCTKYEAFYIEPCLTCVSLRTQFLLTKDNIIRIQRWWRSLFNQECPVCLLRGQVGRLTNYRCDHFICNDCYQAWSIEQGRQSCPTCRAGITAITHSNSNTSLVTNIIHNTSYHEYLDGITAASNNNTISNNIYHEYLDDIISTISQNNNLVTDDLMINNDIIIQNNNLLTDISGIPFPIPIVD